MTSVNFVSLLEIHNFEAFSQNEIMRITEILLDKYKVSLSDESKDKFNSLLVRKEYDKEITILHQGEVCRDVYLIEKGMLRQFYYKDGRDITEHFSYEGDVVFCIESLFLKEPTTLLMETIEPAVVYFLNYGKFQELCDLYADINQLYRSIIELDLIVSQRKADSWRFENSKERYLRFCKEYPEVVKRASIAHIATYLLMTPETLSRVRAGTL